MGTREDMRLVAPPEPDGTDGTEAAGDYPAGHFIPGPNVLVHRVLGRGGHATVYEAELTVIGKRVALKILHPHLAADEDMAKRMVAEARTLARLEHPNIVQVFNAGFTTDDRGRAFILMELLHGISGRQLLEKKKRLPIANALEVAIDLASGLEVAHRNGVIHLDLKPDNVFVHTATNRAVAKLYDFGIQKTFDPRSAPVGQGPPTFEGTPPYAAPEQLRGETVTPQTDLYAFGVLLFELIAGQRPFHLDEERDESEAAAGGDPNKGSWLVEAQLHKPAPRLSSFLLVPAALEELVAKCLEKDATLRPESIADVGRQLRLVLHRLDATFSKSATTTQELLLAAAQDPSLRAGAAPSPAKEAGRPATPPAGEWRGGTVRMGAPSVPDAPARSRDASAPAPTPERRARFGNSGDVVVTPHDRRSLDPSRASVEPAAVPETLEGVLAPGGRTARSKLGPLLAACGAFVVVAVCGVALVSRGARSTTATTTVAPTTEVASGSTEHVAVTALPAPPPAPTVAAEVPEPAPEPPSIAPPVDAAPSAPPAEPSPSKRSSARKAAKAGAVDSLLDTTFDGQGAPAKSGSAKPAPAKPRTPAPAPTLLGF